MLAADPGAEEEAWMVKKRKVEDLELRLQAVVDGLSGSLWTCRGHCSLVGSGNKSAVRIMIVPSLGRVTCRAF